MGLKTLLAQPDNTAASAEYDKIIQATTDAAIAVERERVVAHLENLDHSKDVVVKAIKDGEAYNTATQSTYMNAMMKASHGEDRSNDNPEGVDPPDGGDDLDGGAEAQANAALGAGLDSALESAQAGGSAAKSSTHFDY